MTQRPGLHHRRIERHRPGAGRALLRRGLRPRAGGAAHRRDRSMGGGAPAGSPRAIGSTAPTWPRSTASSRPARACIAQQGVPDVVIANAGISVGMDTAERGDLDVLARTLRHQQHRPGRHLPSLRRRDGRARQRPPGRHRQRRRDPRPAGPRRLLREQGRRGRVLRKPARRNARQRRQGRHALPGLHRHAADAGQPLRHAVPDAAGRLRRAGLPRHRGGRQLPRDPVADGRGRQAHAPAAECRCSTARCRAAGARSARAS